MRGKIGLLIEQWQKICILAERIIKRREAAAVRTHPALFKRTFLSAHLALPASDTPTSPVSSTASLASSTVLPSSSSFYGILPTTAPLFGSLRPDGAADGGNYTLRHADPQADLARLNITLNALNEINEQCWRGEGCELCLGVRHGLGEVSSHVQRQSDDLEQRVGLRVLFLFYIQHS